MGPNGSRVIRVHLLCCHGRCGHESCTAHAAAQLGPADAFPSGRLPVSEMLVVDEPFREAVLKKMPTSGLEDIAIQQGMRTLWQNGLSRALSGQTSLEETIRVLAADLM